MANLILTRQWVENIYQLETSDPVMGGPDGIDNRQAKELGARTNWLKDQVDGINRDRTSYAPKASPAFTGVPTAPTAAAGTNNTQIATTAFVKTAIASLVGSAPAALDTLEEIARALAGDANLKQTLLTEIGKKTNATDFNALHDLFIGVPIPYPLSAVPAGCLAMNGQRFDKARYPKLGQKYPSGQLPDLRGEFVRGWDNGRGLDVGRALLSAQEDALQNHFHYLPTNGGGTNRENITAVIRDNYGDYSGTAIGGWSEFKGDNNEKLNNNAFVKTYSLRQGVQNVKFNDTETRPRNIAFHYICLAA